MLGDIALRHSLSSPASACGWITAFTQLLEKRWKLPQESCTAHKTSLLKRWKGSMPRQPPWSNPWHQPKRNKPLSLGAPQPWGHFSDHSANCCGEGPSSTGVQIGPHVYSAT